MQKKISNDELFFQENGYLIKKIKSEFNQQKTMQFYDNLGAALQAC